MKKNYTFIVLLFLNSILTHSQTSIDFDSFTLGDVSPQSSIIEKWPDPTANPTDAQVSDDFANSAPNSLLIREQTGGIEDDILINLGNKDLGVWEIKFMMYVPTGQNGYFNIQENASINPTSQWNGEFYVGSTTSGGSAGVVSHNNLSGTASFPHDMWFEVRLTVDLDNQEISAFIGNNIMFQTEPYQDNDGNTGFQIGAVDFYSSDANTKFYVDDFEFYETCLEPSISNINAPNKVCSGQTAMMSVATNGEEVTWFDQQTGGTALGTGATFQSAVLQQDTTFWVETRNTTGTGMTCSPDRSKVEIEVTITNKPVGNENQTFVYGETLSDLEVQGNNLKWYADAGGITELSPSTLIADGKTYYVSENNVDCESEFLAITVEEVLSTSVFSDLNLTVYPNPVQNSLNVKLNSNNYSLIIYNIQGKVLLNKENLTKESPIDVSSLNNGFYIIKVTSGKDTDTFKFNKI